MDDEKVERENPEYERRSFPTELRIAGEGDRKVEGHAAVFNKLSDDLGGYREKIDPGAFAETLKTADVRCLFNHDSNYVLGRSTAGTLELEEDKAGLKYTAYPPDTQWARDLMVTIGRGDINQSSFGFRILDEKWDGEVRTITKVELFDVSPVTFPAYPQTSVQARALKDAGIDPEKLDEIFDRSKRGESISDSDRETIQSAVDTLAGAIPQEEVEGPVSPALTYWLDVLKRI